MVIKGFLGDTVYKQFRLLLRQVVCLSVTLRYRDQIGWNSSKITSRLVSLACSPSADHIMDLLQREHPKILTRSDPPPVDLSIADIQWQIVAE